MVTGMFYEDVSDDTYCLSYLHYLFCYHAAAGDFLTNYMIQLEASGQKWTKP